jgi:hypothetical protein
MEKKQLTEEQQILVKKLQRASDRFEAMVAKANKFQMENGLPPFDE